jgi:hypothetical protein
VAGDSTHRAVVHLTAAQLSDQSIFRLSSTFGGEPFDQVLVSSNGYMSFDGRIFEDTGFPSGAVDAYPNFIIPTSDAGTPYDRPDWFLAPFWDDLNAGAVSDPGVFQATLGQAPRREFVVEWQRMAIQAHHTQTLLTFQVVLFEGSNEILFQYKTLSGPQSERRFSYDWAGI